MYIKLCFVRRNSCVAAYAKIYYHSLLVYHCAMDFEIFASFYLEREKFPNTRTISKELYFASLHAWITDSLININRTLPLIFRSCKQVQQLNKSVWNVNSAISSTTLLDSVHTMTMTVHVWTPTLFLL